MADRKREADEEKFNETLKRMLNTPPKPHVNDSSTESGHQGKQDDTPVKKRRPAKKQ